MVNYQKISEKFPEVIDLKLQARKKIPFFAYQYLISGTGDESTLDLNRNRLKEIFFTPQFLKGLLDPNTKTTLFEEEYSAPFGIAPVGFASLIWPQAEKLLAESAKRNTIPFTLSTVGNMTPEEIAPYHHRGWFQLYPPKDFSITTDLLKRVKNSGFKTLIVTADVPYPGKRQRLLRAGVSLPPKITPGVMNQIIVRPDWMFNTLRFGNPTLKTVEKYIATTDLKAGMRYIRDQFGGTLDWEYLKKIRQVWQGSLLLKGILHPDDARQAVKCGVDGIVVSNHGARQFNGSSGAIDYLPEIVKSIKSENSNVKIIFDSGIRSGLDILKAIALGADFTLLGRSFMYGVAALGKVGGDYVYQLLLDDIKNNLHQLGCNTILEVRERINLD